ncbi:J domain-containing protein [Salmonella enterica]|nr:J domain-containing protein [Salmonella enterica]
MNICWEILGIEPTTDLECIRQAYLALLPSFHPESDPQGVAVHKKRERDPKKMRHHVVSHFT